MAKIFTLIKFIDNLDYDYNQKKINKEQFIALQKEKLAELEAEVKAIGINDVTSKTYGTFKGYINESAFDFIVSKMYDKIREKEEVNTLNKAFQYLVNEIIDTKGTAVFFEDLNKAVNAKTPTDNESITQKDFITYEFHKYAWLARHPGQEEMANTMFTSLLSYKSGHSLPDIPAGVDKTLLEANLKEHAAQVTGSKQGEVSIVEQLISSSQSKTSQLDSNNAHLSSQIIPKTPDIDNVEPHLNTQTLLGQGVQESGEQ